MATPADSSSRHSRPWHHHPHVRSGSELTLGERAADRLRNGMGSWPFVFGALVFLGIWMAGNSNRGFDKYPFILLNLLLSCLAAMQGAILLIAAKRSDQVASELAQHDYDQDRRSEHMLERLSTEFALLREQNADLQRQMTAVMAALNPASTAEVAGGQSAGPGEA
ncbi:hypothetical protein GCM10027176_82990 [Actinoallomurus bryophytorum]|uniref:Putative membrane protein n=1 Tax=Actinoallomurus bryophytorum TaxID=1490222 RepID=A0A543C1X0_9ACTN|nr:DUF1003 domain-containing protein [Actinoallomurus bryophytorum]TQL91026.1 putative membrane protein [Actinoallomurus bryophytorum]